MSHSVLASNDLFTILKERHSVRHYDPTAVISDAELTEILELATKAPSSSNTQSWRFVVITDPELKKQLKPVANNQQQVEDASAVIVILGDLHLYEKLEQIYGSAVEAGFMPQDVKERFVENSNKLYRSLPRERMLEIVNFDGGLVAMQIMLIAKSKGYDTVPMGGYNRDGLKELLNLPEHLHPLLLLPIGKAATPGRPTTRLPIGEIVHWNQF
ncbi:nitroreductase family protein [Paenibacillus protaetiae]|uniref:Nitroreductase family protein n=1 Tax=Paenibacillus protaetiae TaxID=2509456 RepID=A0A4V0YFL8_9BACL|nr:nitroreductase family protein [Paenibacillus protaetiae]QAY68161.1 nitroreductase family protein [Paenibacillus protaetiae]